MVEVEEQLIDQSVDSLGEDNYPELNLEIRSLNQDLMARILLAVIAICGFGIFLLLALVLTAASLPVMGIDIPGITAVGEFLSNSFMGLVLTIIFVVTALVSYVFFRRRILGNPLLYTNGGCPQCRENELVRVRRFKPDRLIAYLGIPVRRYTCRNCDWTGLRIGGQPPNVDTSSEATAVDYYWSNDEVLSVSQVDAAAGERTSEI